MNLPAPFTEYTRALLGNEEYEKLSAALDQAPPVSIRLNPSFLTDANSPNSPISLLPSFISYPAAQIICLSSETFEPSVVSRSPTIAELMPICKARFIVSGESCERPPAKRR